MVKRLILKSICVFDILLSPVVLLSALMLHTVRRIGFTKWRLAKRILLKVGVIPVIDIYSEPFYHPGRFKRSLRQPRPLPGICLNEDEQLSICRQFDYADELEAIPLDDAGDGSFFHRNGYYGGIDAEFLYSIIRLRKPKRIIEIGAGYSTLISLLATGKNRLMDPKHCCQHTCIEPYRAEWLDKTEAKVLRKTLEEVDPKIFDALEKNDILFIDSSHVIKPQGDVLMEYLEILPRLSPGVLIHIDDIRTPRDYADVYLHDRISFLNEQYLVEAFLSFNSRFGLLPH